MHLENNFALLGEVLILNAGWPTGMAMVGVGVVFTGLTLFVRFQERGA